MGQIFKIGDVYYIEFEARGLKYQQKAGDSEQDAKELLESIEAKIRHGEIAAVVRDAPIPLFIKDFLEFSEETYPAKTASRLNLMSNHFFTFLRRQYPTAIVLSNVTPKVVEDYKFSLVRAGTQPWVVNFTLLLMREMFEFAIKLGHLNDNPTLHIRFIPDERKQNITIQNNRQAQDLLGRGLSLFGMARVMKIDDILRAMPFFPFLRSLI